MKFTVIGTGYVGTSLSVLLSTFYDVIAYDINKNNVKKINQRKSPIKDKYIEKFLKHRELNLKASSIKEKALRDSDYVIICTPTNYDTKNNTFDTTSVDKSIKDIRKINKKAIIVIKSTVPIGYTKNMREKYKYEDIFFSPEFLRETKALYDNLYPSRIIVGSFCDKSMKFAKTLLRCSNFRKNKVKIIQMDSEEAEAVKLFSNTFLAMRVAYFNEMDSFSIVNGLNSRKIIEGICEDPRIGNYYNNPSFGYGGYCLPKDTQQLLKNFSDIPNNIIKAVVDANQTRKKFIANLIMKEKPKKIGIYRLIMKEGSDNFRDSAVLDIIKKLIDKKFKIILYEPFIKSKTFKNMRLSNNLKKFKSESDIIIANRTTKDLQNFKGKIFTRDIFNKD